MQPPFGVKQVAKLRARLIEDGPMVADLEFPDLQVPAVESGHVASPDQMMLPGGADGAGPWRHGRMAIALREWHRRMIVNADLFHFSTPLIRHAWDCESDFGPLPTEGMFPSRWGLAVFASPVEVPVVNRGQRTTTPICALAWGPLSESGFTPLVADMEQGGDGVHRTSGYHPLDKDDIDSWTHLRALTLTSSIANPYVRAAIPGPLVDEFDLPVRCAPGLEVGHDDHGDLYALARLLRITMELATDSTHGTATRERAGLADRAKAREAGSPITAEGDIRVLGLRPRTAALVDWNRGTLLRESDVYQRDRNYVQLCWRVRDSIDPVTGAIRKKGRIYYRHPALLKKSRSGTTVRSGTLPEGMKSDKKPLRRPQE